ncbi:MAG: hypothetical protein JWO20_1497 [Candidatus Angelobacter sp.]|jgi:hypothetical protein|nr:hypothetical protein [Candidatus Angelobacter sp.]
MNFQDVTGALQTVARHFQSLSRKTKWAIASVIVVAALLGRIVFVHHMNHCMDGATLDYQNIPVLSSTDGKVVVPRPITYYFPHDMKRAEVVIKDGDRDILRASVRDMGKGMHSFEIPPFDSSPPYNGNEGQREYSIVLVYTCTDSW